ncbi:uncharacterized protein LOC132314478 [Cornus florida]|uniref:uncharacterized protein LOC132314478 n=1 Tax=Cornus florida TaxID=4283 RepID=UPI0028A06DF5|nr:uncharacterized protein LOC132314478 [Cornus florida]
MEVLSCIIKKYVMQNTSFKYHWRCKELGITHFAFADDLLLLCHGDIASISTLKSALDLLSSSSGLSINPSKSFVFFSGVPLISTGLKAADCNVLLDKITTRVTSKSLSYAGRLVLISTQLYWSRIFIIPKKVIDGINAHLRRFLWSGSRVAWSFFWKAKFEGGLGLPNLELANKAAILRHLWDRVENWEQLENLGSMV